ncbi:molecular chaperone [Erythrobacteraceae bacterium CFH 75059]|nr:molecular chaperone [Erythrobacteraceae bacterium CFH 75059]
MKRFYRDATVEKVDGGFAVALDGRVLRTQRERRIQCLPSRASAELLAEEWARQGDTIDPSDFPLRALADFALEEIAHAPEAATGRILRFGETDTLCYRAHPDEPLHVRQIAVWDPLLADLERRLCVRFRRIGGVSYRPQHPETLHALHDVLTPLHPVVLAAAEQMASLSASLVITLLATLPGADEDALWSAATLEEEWQAEQWGRETTAEERRRRRRAEFATARRFALAALDGERILPGS